MNMMMNGNSTSSSGPIALNVCSWLANTQRSSPSNRHGTSSRSAMVRWSCRSWPSTRRAVANMACAFIG